MRQSCSFILLITYLISLTLQQDPVVEATNPIELNTDIPTTQFNFEGTQAAHPSQDHTVHDSVHTPTTETDHTTHTEIATSISQGPQQLTTSDTSQVSSQAEFIPVPEPATEIISQAAPHWETAFTTDTSTSAQSAIPSTATTQASSTSTSVQANPTLGSQTPQATNSESSSAQPLGGGSSSLVDSGSQESESEDTGNKARTRWIVLGCAIAGGVIILSILAFVLYKLIQKCKASRKEPELPYVVQTPPTQRELAAAIV